MFCIHQGVCFIHNGEGADCVLWWCLGKEGGGEGAFVRYSGFAAMLWRWRVAIIMAAPT